MFPDGSDAQDFESAKTPAERLALEDAAPDSGEVHAADLPMGPPGMPGITPADVAGSIGALEPLTGGRDHQRDAARRALLAAADSPPEPKMVTVQCPSCGKSQPYLHGEQKCTNCHQKLKPPESAADETPFVGNSFSQESGEFVLNLADGGADHPNEVQCPICKTMNDWSNEQCKNCKMMLAPAKKKALNAAQEAAEEMVLHLSGEELQKLNLAPKQAQRMQWAKEGKARPDGSWPIPNVAYLKKACQAFPGRAGGQEGAIKAWILKRAGELNATDIPELDRVKSYGSQSNTNASQPEHNASIVALQLDHTHGDSGLIWKVLCKTGTLALSPGPGQMDIEKPLNLTAGLFRAVKDAYDDKAFEHVTIPESHSNGTLENTGTVDQLDVLDKNQAMNDTRLSQATKATFVQDAPDTLYMLGGLRFTDPKVREKAANGSILNCSVGLKFNYRRKRDGKLYPVALEHTALTNQPWVDGLGAFGADLSGPLFDQEKLVPWDGVFMSNPGIAEPSKPAAGAEDGGTPRTASLSAPESDAGIPATVEPESQTSAGTGAPTLEQILASQQATIEQLQTENRELQSGLQLSAAEQRQQGAQLHLARTNERVKELQEMGVPPAVLKRYKDIRLAAYEADGGTLQLSVKDGDSTVTQEFGPVEQAEYLLAAIPLAESDNVVAITKGIAADALSLSQNTAERQEPSVAERADAIERRTHPERFDPEGKRIPRDKRGAA